MSDYTENLKLFQKVLVEATNEKTQMIMENYPQDIVFSKQHEKAMHKIFAETAKPFSTNHKKASSKKRLIAALVAAIILLFGGLTVYAKRESIINFVEQIFERFTKVSYQEDSDNETEIPEAIEKEFKPTYVPEGYELEECTSDLTLIRVKWQNSDGNDIIFEQSIRGTIYNYDNEQSGFAALTVGDYSVYATHNDYNDTYLWSDGIYIFSFSIDCTDDLQFDEIAQMILSVTEME